MASTSDDMHLVCMNKMSFLMSKILLARNLRRRRCTPHRKSSTDDSVVHLYRTRRIFSRLFEERMLYLKMLLCWVQAHTFRRGCRKIRPRWFEESVKANFTDMQWLKHFKMHRSTFELLVKELEPHLSFGPIAGDKKVALTLYALSSSKKTETTAMLFGVSKQSVAPVIKEVCNSLINALLSKFIKVPEEQVLLNYVKDFEEKWGFPQCSGVLGSIHIPVCMSKLPENAADYINSDGGYSIYLQGIVDPSYKFWDINIGWPGSVQESRVLMTSELWQQMQDKKLFPDVMKEISGENVPICILSGSSYPLTPWLMKPLLTTESSTEVELQYNKALKFVHSAVEIAFKRLKARWNCLATGNIGSIEILPSVATACCILHNMCEEAKEPILDKWIIKAESLYKQPLPSACCSVFGPEAEVTQHALKRYFQNS